MKENLVMFGGGRFVSIKLSSDFTFTVCKVWGKIATGLKYEDAVKLYTAELIEAGKEQLAFESSESNELTKAQVKKVINKSKQSVDTTQKDMFK